MRVQRKARVRFCTSHQHRSPAQWAAYLQGCGDFKAFTYYPKKLKTRFTCYRCSWTYMKASEKYKAEFLKPKKGQMFKRKEYQETRKGKVLGFTTSTGRMLYAMCPRPWSSAQFARMVRRRVGPFFQACFPGKAHIRILIDSEPLLHTDEAKAAFGEFGIEAMPSWPTYSPDLNPQENVWSWVERALRKEGATDSFITFCKKVIVVAKRYPSAIALMPSMHRKSA